MIKNNNCYSGERFTVKAGDIRTLLSYRLPPNIPDCQEFILANRQAIPIYKGFDLLFQKIGSFDDSSSTLKTIVRNACSK